MSEPGFNQSLNYYTIILEKDSVSKYVFVFISVLLIACLVPALYSIIWYEKNGANNRHTIINRLLSAICRSILTWFMTVQAMTIFRYIYGPLHSNICLLALFMRRTTLTCILMYLNDIAVVRYLFIFFLKNVSAFQDDFWFRFLVIWNHMFSSLFQAVGMLLPGAWPVGFNVCNGQAILNSSQLPNSIYFGIEIPTVLFQIIVFTRIKLYRINLKAVDGGNSITEIDKKSIISSTINFTFVSLALAFSGVNLIGNMMPPEKLVMFPNYLFFHFSSLLFPCIITIVFIVFLFVKNPDMKNSVKREIKEKILDALENL